MTSKPKIDREKMLQLYNDGYTPSEIADYFGTKSGLNIEKKLRAEGILIDKPKIRSLWLAGWGIERIMKECNASEEQIREVVFNGTANQR